MEATLSPVAAPAVPKAAADPNPDVGLPLPSPVAFARGLGGYALLGAVATLGTGHASDAAASPIVLVPAVGCLALTIPALLVVHPFLGLKAGPGPLLAAIARPFARLGDLALALVPALLLFRATSGSLSKAMLVLMVMGMAALGFSLAIRHLVAAEKAAGATLLGTETMRLLAWAWALLATLIGARLAAGVLLGM